MLLLLEGEFRRPGAKIDLILLNSVTCQYKSRTDQAQLLRLRITLHSSLAFESSEAPPLAPSEPEPERESCFKYKLETSSSPHACCSQSALASALPVPPHTTRSSNSQPEARENRLHTLRKLLLDLRAAGHAQWECRRSLRNAASSRACVSRRICDARDRAEAECCELRLDSGRKDRRCA
eukprot:2104355-Rhodomonas_salina.1